MISQRDAFFDRLYELAWMGKDIAIVSADMGAPSLDKFRRDFPHRYINVGIAEQNGLSLACGLAKEVERVYFYAIAPFCSLRCYEQHKLGPAAHNLNVTTVAIGAGFSYADSGPTHHNLEDLTIMRALPNVKIYTCSHADMAKMIANLSVHESGPQYVRLDRQLREPNLPVTHSNDGYLEILPDECGDNYILTCGDMVWSVLEALNAVESEFGVIDVYKLPLANPLLIQILARATNIITVEEHVLEGGFGSAVLDFCEQSRISRDKVKRIGITLFGGYCYEYGGRENLRRHYGLDVKGLIKRIKESC